MGSLLELCCNAPQNGVTDLIDPDQAGTLWGLFCARVRRSPDAIAYRDFDAAAQRWRDHSWRVMAEHVDRFRNAFVKEGLRAGDRIAILLPNGIDWICFDMAAHGQGLIVVALYIDDSITDHAYILAHSDAKLLFVDSFSRWDRLRAEAAQFPLLSRVWIRQDCPQRAPPTIDEISCHLAADVLSGASGAAPVSEVAPNAVATLIYTSGTTGRPKGVMLSHKALLWNAAAVAAVIPPRRDDVFFSVLPLTHAFERTLGCYLAMFGGSTVAFSRAPQNLAEDMNVLHPTVLLGVPRLFERMHAAIFKAGEADWILHVLLRLLAWFGWQRYLARQKSRARLASSLTLGLPFHLLDQLVGKKIRARLGGRLRVAVSGGAALRPNVARFLIGVGLPLVEGYGLTEAGPVVTAAAVGDTFPGSVGRPLPGVAATLGETGELLVSSPSLMLGYWKDEDETRRVLLQSGLLATGDIADIIDGRVFIHGRLKEIIILSVGEKINPDLIEAAVAPDALFHQVAVIGHGRPFLAALIVLDRKQWQMFAEARGLAADQPNAPNVRSMILARWNERLASFPRHAQLRAAYVSLEPWAIEAGLLTPTLKVRHQALQKRFAKEIADIYEARRRPPTRSH